MLTITLQSNIHFLYFSPLHSRTKMNNESYSQGVSRVFSNLRSTPKSTQSLDLDHPITSSICLSKCFPKPYPPRAQKHFFLSFSCYQICHKNVVLNRLLIHAPRTCSRTWNIFWRKTWNFKAHTQHVLRKLLIKGKTQLSII
jgi:hypothetical protein